MKKCTRFEEQKGKRYVRGNVYCGIIIFSCFSSTKPCLRFLLICFARKIKGFYQSSLGNEFDFRDIMNVSPNILAKKFQNFKKRRQCFIDKRAQITMTLTDNNDINVFLSLENPCTFLLTKRNTWKRIFNTNSEFSQNRKEKQIMASKTTVNWLFNDIWCYLLICCFDLKIGVF